MAEPVIVLNDSGPSVSTYGPTTAQDHIWALAEKLRPDSSVEVEQMIIALQQKNPDAFDHNNINSLKNGKILRVPSLAEVLQTSPEDAKAAVEKQNTLWPQIKAQEFAATLRKEEA